MEAATLASSQRCRGRPECAPRRAAAGKGNGRRVDGGESGGGGGGAGIVVAPLSPAFEPVEVHAFAAPDALQLGEHAQAVPRRLAEASPRARFVYVEGGALRETLGAFLDAKDAERARGRTALERAHGENRALVVSHREATVWQDHGQLPKVFDCLRGPGVGPGLGGGASAWNSLCGHSHMVSTRCCPSGLAFSCSSASFSAALSSLDRLQMT